jgi:hypothetical protein
MKINTMAAKLLQVEKIWVFTIGSSYWNLEYFELSVKNLDFNLVPIFEKSIKVIVIKIFILSINNFI